MPCVWGVPYEDLWMKRNVVFRNNKTKLGALMQTYYTVSSAYLSGSFGAIKCHSRKPFANWMNSLTYRSSCVGVCKSTHCGYLHYHMPWQVLEKHICTSIYTLCNSGTCVVWFLNYAWTHFAAFWLMVIHKWRCASGPVISTAFLLVSVDGRRSFVPSFWWEAV